MNLTDQQKNAVRSWVAQNASISDVQKRLADQFGVSMTYMDVRFLIDDLGAELVDAPEAPSNIPTAPAEVPAPADMRGDGAGFPPPQPEQPAGAQGGVQVSLSRIQRPGALASGDVVFSDGEKAEWIVDQMGRLSLIAKTQGYQPSQEDVLDFQTKLQAMF